MPDVVPFEQVIGVPFVPALPPGSTPRRRLVVMVDQRQ